MKQSYTVYHCSDWRVLSTPSLGEQFWLAHREYYVQVAEVFATSLDEVFQLTNHIGGAWQHNADVQCLVAGPVRSTSVGDVLVQGEAAWLVAPCGFTLLAEVGSPSE